MAASIGAKIGLEGEAEFRQALSGIDTGLKTLRTEMTAVTSGFDRSDKSVQKLSAQNEVLTKTIEAQKNKVNELQKQVEKSAAAYGEADSRTQKYQQQLNQATAALNRSELQFKSNEAAIKNHTAETVKATMQTEEMKKAQERLKGTMTAVKVAVVAVVGAMATMAYKAGTSADDLNTLAAQTGLTTNEIQRFQFATEIIDVSLETLTKSMARLIRNMQGARQGSKNQIEAFEELGVTILENDGKLRNHHDVFEEIIDALGKTENETQRDAIAMQFFGRSAQELNPLILGGAEALRELGDEAEAAGLILSQEALDGANELNDAIDKLKATATNTFLKIGSEIATGLTPYVADLGEKLKNMDFSWLVKGFEFIIKNGKLIITTITAIGAGMLAWNVSQTIYAVVSAIKVWQGALKAAELAQYGLNAAMAANPIGIVITLVATLAAGLWAYSKMAGAATTESEKFSEAAKDAAKSADGLKDSVSELNAKHEVQAEQVRNLTDELYKLSGELQSGRLSELEAAAVKEQMNDILRQLHNILPDVRIELDKETGAIITQKGEIESLIDSYIRLAKAKAAQSILEKTELELLENQVKLRQASDELAKAEYNVQAFAPTGQAEMEKAYGLGGFFDTKTQHWKQSKDDVKEYTDSINALTAANAELEAQSKILQDIIRENGGVTTETTEKVKGYESAVTGAAGATKAAAKDETKTLKDEYTERLKNLKYNFEMEYITEKQYYSGIETLRDMYFETDSEEWQKHTLEIRNYQKKTFEGAKKEIETLSKEIFDSMKSEYDGLENVRKTFETRLNGYAKLFQDIKITSGEGTVEFRVLGDIQKANAEMEIYRDLLLAVKERGGEDMFQALRELDPAEAAQNAELLLQASDEDFNRYLQGLKDNKELSREISELFFTDEATEIAEKYAEQLKDLEGNYYEVGENYAEALGEGFKAQLDAVFAGLKNEITGKIQSINAAFGGNVSAARQPLSITNNLTVAGGAPTTSFTNALARTFKILNIKGALD